MKAMYALSAVLAGSFITRIACILSFKTFLHPRIFEYEAIIDNLLGGRGFVTHHIGNAVYHSLNNPLYSFISAGIYYVTGHSYFAVMVMHALFSVLLAFVIFGIGKRLFGEWQGCLAAALVAFHPGFVYYDIYVLVPLGIDSFCIALAALLFLRYVETPKISYAVLAGAVIGLGMLTRSIIGALLPAVALYMLFFLGRVPLARRIRDMVIVCAAALIVLAPWIARNYIVHREFVFIMSTSGEALWRGNNPYATGTSMDADATPILNRAPQAFQDEVASLDELGQKQLFEREAIAYIKAHPLVFVRNYLKKLYYFWWFSPQSGINYPGRYLALYRIGYGVLLVAAVLGFVSAMKSVSPFVKHGSWLIVFMIMAIPLAQSVFYSEGRHRWLVEPLLMIFAAKGIFECAGFFVNRPGCAHCEESHA